MRSVIGLIVTMAALQVASCGYVPFDLEKYKQAVKSGFAQIPQAKQMEELFGEGDNFISVSHGANSTETWNTEVWFADRYVLTMQAQVKVNRDFSKVLAVSSPVFYLIEVTEVDPYGGASNGDNFSFGADDWEKVVKAKGDFSVIGIHVKRNAPVPNFQEYVAAWRRGRIHVRPEDP